MNSTPNVRVSALSQPYSGGPINRCKNSAFNRRAASGHSLPDSTAFFNSNSRSRKFGWIFPSVAARSPVAGVLNAAARPRKIPQHGLQGERNQSSRRDRSADEFSCSRRKISARRSNTTARQSTAMRFPARYNSSLDRSSKTDPSPTGIDVPSANRSSSGRALVFSSRKTRCVS